MRGVEKAKLYIDFKPKLVYNFIYARKGRPRKGPLLLLLILLNFDKKLLIFNAIRASIELHIKKDGETMKKETVIIFTKFLLDFMYFAGIAVTVLLSVPGLMERVMALFGFQGFEGRYTEIIIIYFVLGILAVLILGELRKMFRTVLKEDCFVKDNVVSLQRMGTYSFVIAVICLLRTVLYMTIAMLVLVLVFVIAGLFSKVLAFVFDKAVEYKLENDLTI